MRTAGIVLSGGGARGAYEVGVAYGIIEALGLRPADPAPFDRFTGTSVGAINATFLASRAHRGDLGVRELVETWRGLRVGAHLRVDLLSFLGWPRTLPWLRSLRSIRRRASLPDAEAIGPRLGRSLLDPRPLEEVVQSSIRWQDLHENTRSGKVRALIVAALEIATGRTCMFAQLSPDTEFRPSPDPRRVARRGPICADHVLASAAIPVAFPARRIGAAYYCDGGLRFNTPIAPLIRSGADRMVVVSLLRPMSSQDTARADAEARTVRSYPSLVFLLGKVLNAMMLDPVAYDLQVLERFNRLAEVLDQTLAPEQLERVDRVMVETRGHRYTKIDTLVFTPSADLGKMAGAHVRDHIGGWRMSWPSGWLLRRAATAESTWESDLASYLLFDGSFAEKLVDVGRTDALARREEIRDFFAV